MFNVNSAAENIRDGERVALGIRLYRVVDVHLGQLVLDLTEVHFYLIIYYTLMETHYNKYPCVSVRIVRSKKPGTSLLCSEDIEMLTVGEQIRDMRLCTGYTIKQAAREVGVWRMVVMNYELGKVTRVNPKIIEKLMGIYNK